MCTVPISQQPRVWFVSVEAGQRYRQHAGEPPGGEAAPEGGARRADDGVRGVLCGAPLPRHRHHGRPAQQRDGIYNQLSLCSISVYIHRLVQHSTNVFNVFFLHNDEPILFVQSPCQAL